MLVTLDVIALILAGLMVVAAVAYGAGRRRGTREGFDQGVGYAPLALRRHSLERGGCVLCGSDGAWDKEDAARGSLP